MRSELTTGQLNEIAEVWGRRGCRSYSGGAWDGIDSETQLNFIRGFRCTGSPVSNMSVYLQGWYFRKQWPRLVED